MTAEPISSGDNEAATTVSDCLRSWRDELAAIAARIWGPIARESARFVSVSFSAFGVTIARVEQDGETILAIIPSNSGDTERLAVTALQQAGASLRTADVAIVLPAGEVLRPRVRLPYVPRRSIRSMLGYELERLSPLPPEELYYDFRVVARERKANRTEVDLRIIKRSVLDEALAVVHAAGFSAGTILFERDQAPADWRHFPVDRIGFLRAHWRRHSIALLAALNVLLLIAVVFAAYARGMATLSAIEDQSETERIVALRVEHIRSEIKNTRAQIEFAVAKKNVQPSLLSVVAAVTDALPDGTWLTDMKVDGMKVHAQGYSHAASDLIGLIDRSPRLANAQFNAPVVQSSNKLDRFDISFNVKADAP
jgi:general secretion pathway protein L